MLDLKDHIEIRNNIHSSVARAHYIPFHSPTNAFSPTSHDRREAINRWVPCGRSGPPPPLLPESGSQGQGHGRHEQAQRRGAGTVEAAAFPGKSAHASRERLHEAGRSAARGTERTRPASVALEGVDVKQTVCQPTDTPERDRLVRRTRSPFVYFTAFSPPGARTGARPGPGPAASAAEPAEPGSTSAPRGFSFQRARRSI